MVLNFGVIVCFIRFCWIGSSIVFSFSWRQSFLSFSNLYSAYFLWFYIIMGSETLTKCLLTWKLVHVPNRCLAITNSLSAIYIPEHWGKNWWRLLESRGDLGRSRPPLPMQPCHNLAWEIIHTSQLPNALKKSMWSKVYFARVQVLIMLLKVIHFGSSWSSDYPRKHKV